MDRDKLRELLNDWGAAALVAFAVAWGLSYRGISGENVADAVRDIGTALVPIFAALFAARLVSRDKDPSERCVREGEDALRAVQKGHSGVLSGPKFNRDSYDSDKPPGAGRYLFVQKGGKGNKGQLVPVVPFREGIVQVQVSDTTRKVLGITQGLDETHLQVREAVEALLKSRFPKVEYEPVETKNPRVVLTVDFDEHALPPRTFGRIVRAVAEEAIHTLKQLRA